MSSPIYLDHHSTTPVDARVLAVMLPFFTERFGNAASRTHAFGWVADQAVEAARSQVAAAIGGEPQEVVFTSGATEALNLAIQGTLASYTRKGNHVVTVATEHPAVLDTCKALERARQARVTVLTPQPDGLLDLEALAAVIEPETVLVAVMAANNEVGVLQDLPAIGAVCREKGCFFLSDAAQAVGKVPLDVQAAKVDLLALSAHKLYGPKGAGALWVRRRDPRVRVAPVQHGGGHERGLRSGTLDVPAIVGLGAACALAVAGRAEEAARVGALRDRLWAGLQARVPGVVLHGHPTRRLPGNLNVGFPGVPGDLLLPALPRLAVSSGSACASATPEPSHVLRALGVPDDLAHASLRFGVGRTTTEAQVDQAIDDVAEAVARLRVQ